MSAEITTFLLENSPTAVSADEIAAARSLVDDGILDSLGIWELVGWLEQRYGVSLKPDDVVLDNFDTLAAIEALVLRKTQGQ